MPNNKQNFSVREMRNSDIEMVLQLQNQLAFLDWNQKQYIQEIESPSTIAIVAEKENDVVGFALFHLLVDESELLAIAVSPKYQRAGIGSLLFTDGKMKLQNFGADKLFLEVRESNQKARNFYESLNASLVGRRVKYYKDGESAAIYRIDF